MSKARRSAKGKPCTLRIAGVCSYDASTTILAHIRGIRGGEGMGRKPSDSHAVYCCARCHDHLDRRVPVDPDFEKHRYWYIASALAETHRLMMEAA